MHPDTSASHQMTKAVFGRCLGKCDVHTTRNRRTTPTPKTRVDSHIHELGIAVRRTAEQTAAPRMRIAKVSLPSLEVAAVPMPCGCDPGRRSVIKPAPLSTVPILSTIAFYMLRRSEERRVGKECRS